MSGLAGDLEARWWEGLYDGLLAEVLLERTSDSEVARTVAFLRARSGCEPGARFFDQCCGTGRLSLALAAAGYAGVGIDQAAGYIERAATAARRRGLSERLDFEAADAFDYRAAPPCDFAFNWWTSFGYAATDDENRGMLERARESVVAGGFFALDFMNVPGVIRGFRPVVRDRVESARGEIALTRESELDLEGGVMHKRWFFSVEGGAPAVRRSAVRLYAPDDLRRLFGEAGFEGLRCCGDLDGRPVTEDSPRCIVTGRAPAR